MPEASMSNSIFRIWLTSKSCPKCRSTSIRLKSSVSFKDRYQYWLCDGCFWSWPEYNGVLASEMKTAVDPTERSIIE
jgi:transposase-like protein